MLTTKAIYSIFPLCTLAISFASPLNNNAVYNNLKISCLLHLYEILNSNLAYVDFSRLKNLAELLKYVWAKMQDPHNFR